MDAEVRSGGGLFRRGGPWLVVALIIAAKACRSSGGLQAGQKSSGYLSDSDPAYAAAERLQKAAYATEEARRGAPLTPGQRPSLTPLKGLPPASSPGGADARREFQKFLLQAEALQRRQQDGLVPPTRYEDGSWNLQVKALTERLDATVKSQQLSMGSRLVFATLPTRGIGAEVFTVPGGTDRLALFHSDLFMATYLVTKVLVETLEWGEGKASYRRDKVLKRLNDAEVISRFRQVLTWYTGPAKAKLSYWSLEPVQLQLAMTLTRSMELFAIAHEYGHVLLKHAPRPARTLTEQAWSWQQELEADREAWALVVETQRLSGTPFENAYGFWGPELLLAVLDILDRADSMTQSGTARPAPMTDPNQIEMLRAAEICLATPDSESCRSRARTVIGTHPPSWLRRTFVRRRMKDIPQFARVMDDSWDFGNALILAGYSLLSQVYGPVAAGMEPKISQ